VGWWIGSLVGTFTAIMMSIVGLGVGIYAGKRLADRIVS
jgi:hypothetical protein